MVLDDLLRDGREALAAADWERARRCFEGAVETEATPESLDGLAWALLWLGEDERAAEAATRAYAAYRQAGRPVEAAEQARRLAFLEGAVRGNLAVAAGWFARAERLLTDVGEGPHHGWLACDRAPLTDDPAERERLAATALALGRRYGDADLEFDALALLGEVRVVQGRVAEGMAMLDEAMAAVSAGEVSDVVAAGDIYCRLLGACEHAVDVRRAEEWMDVARRFADRTRSLLVSATCRMHYGAILVATGRWADAEEELTTAAATADRGFRGLRAHPAVRLAELRVAQGRYDDARRLLGGAEWHPRARAALARVALAEGDARLAEELARLCLADEHGALTCAPVLDLLVEAQLERGDDAAAAATVDRLEALAERDAPPYVQAFFLRAAGRLLAARGDPQAIARLQNATSTFAGARLPLESARASLLLAEVLAADSPAAAVAQARSALASFDRLGAAGDADAAGALLRRLGAPRGARGRGAGVLTPREREVLGLLGEGLSNAAIARRLVISPRTAEHHVASILAKLGLRGRAEAAAHAVREGVHADP